MDVPVGLAGTLTIFFLVAFGVFFYPWLLKRPRGALGVAVSSVLLAVLFYLFDDPDSVGTMTSVGLAVFWALLPVATGIFVWRLQTKGSSAS
jgi:uncharacterized MnhB-related membrane protein